MIYITYFDFCQGTTLTDSKTVARLFSHDRKVRALGNQGHDGLLAIHPCSGGGASPGNQVASVNVV
jgi:hypothetical protein